MKNQHFNKGINRGNIESLFLKTHWTEKQPKITRGIENLIRVQFSIILCIKNIDIVLIFNCWSSTGT